MSIPLRLLALMALAFSLAFGSTATMANTTTHHPFVKAPFYHGKNGGQAVPLHVFAQEPLRYMRSAVAYQALLEHVSETLGRKVDDTAFRALITSDEVRLIDCQIDIETAGITAGGEVGWNKRRCYLGEHLLQVRVPGGWVTVASQGCYNPVKGVRPADPPTPVAGVCGPNAQHFAVGTIKFPSQEVKAFCSAGKLVGVPGFPAPGGRSDWACEREPAGAGVTQQCVATVPLEPVTLKVEVPPQKPAEKATPVLGISTPTLIRVPGLPGTVVLTCYGVVATGGTVSHFFISQTTAPQSFGQTNR